jgi:hypothetical protein
MNTPDITLVAHSEVKRIVNEALHWNSNGFKEMPAQTIAAERSALGPITFTDLLVRETLVGLGFRLRMGVFRGKRTLFVSWSDEKKEQFFSRPIFKHWSKLDIP